MSAVADLFSDLAGLSDTVADLLRDASDVSLDDTRSYQLRVALLLVCQIGFIADTAAQAQGNSPTIGGAPEWFVSEALRATARASSDSQANGGAA